MGEIFTRLTMENNEGKEEIILVEIDDLFEKICNSKYYWKIDEGVYSVLDEYNSSDQYELIDEAYITSEDMPEELDNKKYVFLYKDGFHSDGFHSDGFNSGGSDYEERNVYAVYEIKSDDAVQNISEENNSTPVRNNTNANSYSSADYSDSSYSDSSSSDNGYSDSSYSDNGYSDSSSSSSAPNYTDNTPQSRPELPIPGIPDIPSMGGTGSSSESSSSSSYSSGYHSVTVTENGNVTQDEYNEWSNGMESE